MADQTVLKAFKRFDKDGSGSITREELGQARGESCGGGGRSGRNLKAESQEHRRDKRIRKSEAALSPYSPL